MLNEWFTELGDSSFWACLITALYGVAIIFSIYFIRVIGHSFHNKEMRLLWICITILLTVLGLNKQLDLQTLLIIVGRSIAEAQGWGDYRRVVQALFTFMLGLGLVLSGAVVLFRVRRAIPTAWIEITGTMVLLGYTMIRAGAISHIGRAESIESVAIRIHAFELFGVMIILFAIVRHLRRMKFPAK
jgi:hypothetical protein